MTRRAPWGLALSRLVVLPAARAQDIGVDDGRAPARSQLGRLAALWASGGQD